MRQLHLQIVRTADDDGTGGGTISANEVVALVNAANDIFVTADVQFVYDPAKDFTHINSTLLNQTYSALEVLERATDPNKTPALSEVPHSRARTRVAELFPDRIVVYFSKKTRLSFDDSKGHWVLIGGNKHSSAGLGWYVGMLATASGTVLAHELGHFLQNRHTFGSEPKNVAEAAAAIKKYVEEEGHPKLEGALVFDGDSVWVRDTPVDPGKGLFENVHGSLCGAGDSVDVPVTFTDGSTQTFHLEPDRTNFMSYFRCTGLANPVRMSAQQAWRVRDGLDTGLRNRLIALRGAKISGVLTRKDSASGGTTTANALIAIGSGRVVTAMRNGSSDLELNVWDLGVDGAQIRKRGSASGGTVTEVAASYCGLGLVATAVKTASNTLKVILWKVDGAGNITREGDASADQMGSVVSVCRIGLEYLATASQTSSGNLKVIAWRVTASGTITRKGSGSGGAVSDIVTAESWPLSITDDGAESFSYGQLTTGVRDASGNFKVIHWGISDDGNTVVRLSDADAGKVDDIALCPLPPRTLISAVRDGSGNLKLISWALNDAGLAVDRWDSTNSGAVSEIAICPAGVDLIATAVRATSGALVLIVWRSLAGGAEIVRINDATAGEASRITVCQAGPGLLATAVRDASGNLKLIAWRLQ